MTDRKNIKLPADLFDALKDDKSDHMSWPVYFEQRCLGDDSGTETSAESSIDTDALNELLGAARTIEERTNSIERQLENMEHYR